MRLLAAAVLVALSMAACGDVTNLVVIVDDAGSADASTDATIRDPSDADTPSDSAGASDATLSGSDSTSDASVGDPVFGNLPFTPQAPTKTANGVPEHASEVPLQGKNCFKAGGCHAESASQFGFAGTVFESINGGDGLPLVEVRVVNAQGAEIGRAFTDADGNFWSSGPKPSPGSRVGVRGYAGKRIQTLPLSADDGACNSGACHGQSTMRIYLP